MWIVSKTLDLFRQDLTALCFLTMTRWVGRAHCSNTFLYRDEVAEELGGAQLRVRCMLILGERMLVTASSSDKKIKIWYVSTDLSDGWG